ncbi:hypothetical protein ACFL59_04515 [Planctomycetota bacterium]
MEKIREILRIRLSLQHAFHAATFAACLAIVWTVVAPVPAAAANEELEKAVQEIEEELNLTFEKLVAKKKKKTVGMYHFLKAVNLYKAGKLAQAGNPEAKLSADETAALIFLNEAHEQLTMMWAKSKKKLKQEAEDKKLDKSAEKKEKKIRFTVYDDYLEFVELKCPDIMDYCVAKDWKEVKDLE